MSEVSSGPVEIEQIYRSLSGPLTRLAYLLVGDQEEAQDVVQSVFATAAKRWTTIDEPHPFLRQAVVNRANDSHRKAFRRTRAAQSAAPAIPDEPVLDGVWDLIQTPRSHGVDPNVSMSTRIEVGRRDPTAFRSRSPGKSTT